ncbi:MAG: amidohydrolase, partial [Maribacter sp.]
MSNLKKTMVLGTLAIFLSTAINAQQKLDDVLKALDAKSESYSEIAQTIWDLAEMGYQEEKSAELLQKTLADAGFTIKKGVAGIPTAFTAEYGSGAPIIGIMGEYDALP